MTMNDDLLLSRIVEGDQKAFAKLITRYEQPIGALIRYRIINPDDAEDVLQETLLDAWVGLRRLRKVENLRAWLLSVARNRCNDYFRSPQRRDNPTDSTDLELYIDSFACSRNGIIDDVFQAVGELPGSERDVIKSFYLHGFTLKEISERSQRPIVTLKRQLYEARMHLRQALGAKIQGEVMKMNQEPRIQPFPEIEPEISIKPLGRALDPIDCQELRWWGIIPVIDNRAMSATYSSVDKKLTRITDVFATRKAHIHNVEGIEISVDEWLPEKGWFSVDAFFYGRILEDKTQWLGSLMKTKDETKIRTFLDEGFVWAYPDNPRIIATEDLITTKPDGSLETSREHTDFVWSGSGYYEVVVGDRAFKCLRMVGLEGPLSDKRTSITEAYISDFGRMVFMRTYVAPGIEGFTINKGHCIVVNDHTFYHCLDILTDVACGIDLQSCK